LKKTIIQKIFENHSKTKANIGDIVDVAIDVRVARDFGGANVVKNLIDNTLSVENPKKTFFTLIVTREDAIKNMQQINIFVGYLHEKMVLKHLILIGGLVRILLLIKD